MPSWCPVYLFFEISSPIWLDRGIPVPSFPDFADNFIVLVVIGLLFMQTSYSGLDPQLPQTAH